MFMMPSNSWDGDSTEQQAVPRFEISFRQLRRAPFYFLGPSSLWRISRCLANSSVIAFEMDDGGDDSTNANAPAEMWIMNANGTDQQSLGIPCDESGCAPRFQPQSTTSAALAAFSAEALLPTAIPEPSTWAMMLLGFAGVGFAGYRHKAFGPRVIR